MTAATNSECRGIAVDDLHIAMRRQHASVPLVRGVSFRVNVGETLALVGESGAGKSLTARSLLGVLPAATYVSSGSIRVNGVDVVRADDATLRRIRGGVISFIPQDPMSSLNPVRKIGKIFKEVLARHRRPGSNGGSGDRERIVRVLSGVGLDRSVLERYPHQLSGGMKQRVLIALALLTEPTVIVADEPTTALDATVQAEILDLLARHVAANVALIMITHDLGVAATVCKDIAVMYCGQIVERGPINAILERPRHPYTRGLLAAAPDFDSSRPSLVPIRGNPPTPGDLPRGCSFAPRCDLAGAQCLDAPTLSGDAHAVACWRADVG